MQRGHVVIATSGPILGLVVILAASCASQPRSAATSDPATTHAFPTTIVAPHSADFVAMSERMRALDNPGGLGSIVGELLRLDRVRAPIRVEECGRSAAVYAPATREITICYEFIRDLNRLSGRPDPFAFDRHAAIVTVFITLHEIGHALVHQLDLPITVDEEDAADEFALLVLTKVTSSDGADLMIRPAAAFFYGHGVEQERTGGPDPGDPHSPSKRRAAAAACILYGRHRSAASAAAVGDAAQDCIAYTDERVVRWNTWLAPYARTSPAL